MGFLTSSFGVVTVASVCETDVTNTFEKLNVGGVLVGDLFVVATFGFMFVSTDPELSE